jgi:hypothetical protein
LLAVLRDTIDAEKGATLMAEGATTTPDQAIENALLM